MNCKERKGKREKKGKMYYWGFCKMSLLHQISNRNLVCPHPEA